MVSSFASGVDGFFITVRDFLNQRRVHYYLSSSNNEYNHKSIGDLVNNLHGGKYQFQDSLLAGSTRIGQEFADSLYSSSECIEDKEDEEMPNWALRLMNPSIHINRPIVETLVFSQIAPEHTIIIKNDERSWERFYVFLLPQLNDMKDVQNTSNGIVPFHPFATNPTSGVLAPRGGASNACDANAPYSDSSAINLKWIDGRRSVNDHLLVAATEAEVWRYLLQIK
jgi:hypothetical protein